MADAPSIEAKRAAVLEWGRAYGCLVEANAIELPAVIPAGLMVDDLSRFARDVQVTVRKGAGA